MNASGHVHGCLNCRPDMVPDFDPADSRYHRYGYGAACRSAFRVLVNGSDVSYTRSAFEGVEGWTLFAGATADDIHPCTCASDEICVEPRFGSVEIRHEGEC